MRLWVKDKGIVLGQYGLALLQQAAADHWLHPLYLVSEDQDTWVDARDYENGLLWKFIDRGPIISPPPPNENQIWVKERGRMLGPYSLEKLQSLATDNWLSKMHLISEDRIHWIFASHYKDGIAWKTGIPAVDSKQEEKVKPVSKQSVKPPAENEWWYEKHRHPIGPVPLTQIRNLFGMGELKSNQLVWTHGNG